MMACFDNAEKVADPVRSLHLS